MRHHARTKSVILVTVLCFVACGDPPKPAGSRQYILDAQAFDPATGTLTVNISVPPNATQDWVKAAVQEIVDERKQEYKIIWVRTYAKTPNDRVPLAVSYYDNSGLTHQFVVKSEDRKIPTH